MRPNPSCSSDNFSAGVKGILAHRAGYRCSRPSCRALTAGPSDERSDARTNVGVAAHITAASPGGARYDATLPAEERRSVTNGIWLCQTHAKEIDDDGARFTAEILKAWKRHAEEEARALLGKPISTQSLDVAIQVVVHRASDNSLLVSGSTNLPNGTKLWVQLQTSGARRLLGQIKSKVNEGMFAAAGFTNRETAHPHGWYTVEVLAYFNGPWRQPDAVLEIVGRDGENLVGIFAEPLHPEFAESEKRFRAAFECIAPPLTNIPIRSPSDLQRAIELAKRAILVVDDRRSASPVEEVVAQFMSSSGLRPHEGWSAEPLANGAIVARYSFWSGDRPAVAEWTVVLDHPEVRYRNLDAKYMSWAPGE